MVDLRRKINMQAFLDTFSKYIIPEDILILAVSGWVDSMVLLDLVLRNHPKEQIIVAHFDHSLRGVESDEDRLFIADFCEKRNIRFEVEKTDITSLAGEEKMSIEMAARKYRYIFLHEIAEKYQAKYIFTAHHLDDRIETAMFNLIRGTKLGGIVALSEIQNSKFKIHNGEELARIFRPLLHIQKSQILEYAREQSIDYHEDSTNTDTTYLRNHLRHTVLPEFERINPEYRRAIENLIEYSGEVQDWIDDQVREWLYIQAESFKNKSLEFPHQNQESRILNQSPFLFLIPDFREQPQFFQREVVRYLYEEANAGTIWLSEWLIEELIRFITEGSNSYGIREVKKLRLERRGERILWG